MKCSVCNTRLKNTAIFCDTCGNKLEKDSQPTIALPRADAARASAAPAAPRPPLVALLLGGAALLLIGVWTGASFFSAAPAPIEAAARIAPEAPQPAKRDLVLLQEPAKSEPVVAPVVAPEVVPVAAPVVLSPAPAKESLKSQDGHLVDPFKKKKSPETKSEWVVDPFGEKKPAAAPPKDGTLTPRFKAELDDPFSKR